MLHDFTWQNTKILFVIFIEFFEKTSSNRFFDVLKARFMMHKNTIFALYNHKPIGNIYPEAFRRRNNRRWFDDECPQSNWNKTIDVPTSLYREVFFGCN